jgi:putative ABC transport system substrate-binding protein
MGRTKPLIAAVISVLVATPAFGQEPTTPLLGVLANGTATAPNRLIVAFRQGLRDLGYDEYRNIRIEYRYSENASNRLADLAADLMRQNPNLLVAAGGNDIARALKAVAGERPVVMAGGSDPVGSGLIDSLAKPGG